MLSKSGCTDAARVRLKVRASSSGVAWPKAAKVSRTADACSGRVLGQSGLVAVGAAVSPKSSLPDWAVLPAPVGF